MSLSILYWVNPYGKILKQHNTTHIRGVVGDPKIFGVTKDWIDQVYKKHNEPVGTEGKAREEIMDYLFKKGYIRVRLYPNQYWSITLTNFRSRKVKKSLSKWAEDAMSVKQAGKYMPVKILDVKTNKMYQSWDVNDIQFDKHIYEDDTEIQQSLDHHPVFITEIKDLTMRVVSTGSTIREFFNVGQM